MQPEVWPADAVERRPIGELIPYARNARTHSAEQVSQIAASIREFGFTIPVLVDEAGGIIAGHGRVMAAKELGLKAVPVMTARGWSEVQKRAYILADNQLPLNAGWDAGLLKGEIEALQAFGFDLGVTGFDAPSIAGILAYGVGGDRDPETIPKQEGPVVSQKGDLWLLGNHRLLCGDSCDQCAVERVLGHQSADLCLTDPPYGIGLAYDGFEDSEQAVRDLAVRWLPIARANAKVVVFSPGVTRQWLYPEPSWVLCWFYGGGQLRSPWGFNCWQPFLCYGKDPSLGKGRGARPDAVDMNTPANAGDINHPCPKPVKLWTWLIERLSMKKGDVIFDPFCGSGTTIVVAEMTGRRCYAIELSPVYVDVAVKRWQEFTGKEATLETTGDSFSATSSKRLAKPKGEKSRGGVSSAAPESPKRRRKAGSSETPSAAPMEHGLS